MRMAMKEQNTNSQNEKREHKKIPIFSSLKFKMVLTLIIATAVTAANTANANFLECFISLILHPH